MKRSNNNFNKTSTEDKVKIKTPLNQQIFSQTFIKHNNDPNDRLNKFFIQKYQNSMPQIIQYVEDKERQDTPFFNAQKSLQQIINLETNDNYYDIHLGHTHSKSFKETNKQINQKILQSTTQQFQIQIDLTSLIQLEKMTSDFLQFQKQNEQQEIPDFQSYWELVFEIKLDQILPYFSKWRKVLNTSILFDTSAVALFQCLYSEFQDDGHKSSYNDPDIKKYMGIILNIIHQNLLIIIELIIQNKVSLLTSKDQEKEFLKIIDQKRVRNLHDDYYYELNKNNQLVELYLKNIVKQVSILNQKKNFTSISLKPIYLIISHSVRNAQNVDVEILKDNIMNAICLTLRKQHKQEDSIFKTFYIKPQDDSQEIVQKLIGIQQEDTDPKPEQPFLQPKNLNSPYYTLVLDLDETIGFFGKDSPIFQKRPYSSEFLNELKNYYEIIIFTSLIQQQADEIITQIDQNSCISHRLYRQHNTQEDGGIYVKNLSTIGRDLDKTLIVDTKIQNFKYNKDNAILIKSWQNDKNDQDLYHLSRFLTKIAQHQQDIRVCLRQFRDHIVRLISNGSKQPQLVV